MKFLIIIGFFIFLIYIFLDKEHFQNFYIKDSNRSLSFKKNKLTKTLIIKQQKEKPSVKSLNFLKYPIEYKLYKAYKFNKYCKVHGTKGSNCISISSIQNCPNKVYNNPKCIN